MCDAYMRALNTKNKLAKTFKHDAEAARTINFEQNVVCLYSTSNFCVAAAPPGSSASTNTYANKSKSTLPRQTLPNLPAGASTPIATEVTPNRVSKRKSASVTQLMMISMGDCCYDAMMQVQYMGSMGPTLSVMTRIWQSLRAGMSTMALYLPIHILPKVDSDAISLL